MSFDGVIGKLEEIAENPQGKLSLYFTRKDYRGRYTSYKPGISIPLQKDLTNIVVEAIKSLSGKTILPFNPSGSLDDTIEFCDYSSVDSLSHILESLDGDKLLEGIPDDISKFSFYCLTIQLDDDDELIIFRRLTKFKKLQKGIVGRFISGDFEKIDSDILGIDGQIDIIGYDSELTIINHISMERIFDIKTQYQESAKQTLVMIKETERIENFEQFEEDSISDGRVIRGLTKLLQDPDRVKRSLENIDKVKELVDVVDLDIKFSDDDKLIYERKDQLQNITLIIRDAYYQSLINERVGVDELA